MGPQLQHPVPGPPQGERRRHWLPPLAVEMKHDWSLVTAAEAVHISLATGSKQSQLPGYQEAAVAGLGTPAPDTLPA